MVALTQQQKRAIDEALDFLELICECYASVPTGSRHVPDDKFNEIKELIENLRQVNDQGIIDWQSNDFSVRAETDRNGIHLNPNFSGDYKNDYQLPENYGLEDCEGGYFSSLWKIIEILIHEKYHYENHTGVLGSANALLADISFATFGNLVEFLSGLSGSNRRLRRKYTGHEHVSYSYTASILFWLDALLFWTCLEGDPACIPCCDKHQAELKKARARQEPYDFR